jgi:replicative DNA helicase
MDNYRDIEQIVLSFLFHYPNLLFDDKYPIKWSDFSDKTHQYIYSAMGTIFSQSGVVNVSEIELQLGKSAGAKRFYEEHNGHSRLCAIENMFLKDFSYESKYQDLKKYSLLKSLNQAGIDTREIYDPSLEPDKAIEMVNKFEQMTYQEIIEIYRKKLASIEDKYENLIDRSGIEAGEGIGELLRSFEEQPEIGVPLIGDLLNTATRGARRKKVYLNSASSGTGKSRMAAGNVAKIGFPLYYDEDKEKWINTGMCYPVLFITTELEHSEVQTMFLSYISGVNEEKILNNRYDTKDEKERVIRAAEIIEKSENVYIEFIPNPSIESVASKIRLYALQKDIEYVFYDYIHVSGATYTNKKDMRDDVWLMLFVDKLKQLANELDIHISTATQVNASSYEDREIKNESLIRGAKSIADKTDFAMITSAILKEQEKAIAKTLATKLGTREPNQILDIYKNRRGKWRSIRIWRYTDLGTCRSTDCFATDTGNNPIDMTATKIRVKQLVKEGSFPIIDDDTGEIVAENRKVSEIYDF